MNFEKDSAPVSMPEISKSDSIARGDKVVLIQQSINCGRYGCWSLVPVIGLGFAILTFWRFWQVKSLERNYFNPGKIRCRLGLLLACVSFWLWTALVVWKIYQLCFDESNLGYGLDSKGYLI
ncbi:MAG TPA: hypothetical protein VF607_15290 [Verrucomicrobiae bacterium]